MGNGKHYWILIGANGVVQVTARVIEMMCAFGVGSAKLVHGKRAVGKYHIQVEIEFEQYGRRN